MSIHRYSMHHLNTNFLSLISNDYIHNASPPLPYRVLCCSSPLDIGFINDSGCLSLTSKCRLAVFVWSVKGVCFQTFCWRSTWHHTGIEKVVVSSQICIYSLFLRFRLVSCSSQIVPEWALAERTFSRQWKGFWLRRASETVQRILLISMLLEHVLNSL